MYKVFVNDKPIVLTTLVEKQTNFKNYKLKKAKFSKIIKKLNKKSIKEVRLTHKNKDKLLKLFLKKRPNVIAGGGKVYNEKGEILFIYRNDKWDLPKGKVEGDEDIKTTAIREVEEETGVTGLTIVKPLQSTYHIFKHKGVYKIKITYWFEMKTSFAGKLYPQEKEGITKVKWLDEKKTKKALKNSYANIKSLI